MSVLEADATILAIAEERTKVDRRLETLRLEVRAKAAEFVRADEANKVEQLAAIEEGRIPPPDLVMEADGSAEAIRLLVDERRRLTKAYERRLGELCREIEAEVADMIEAELDACRPAVSTLVDAATTVTSLMRLVARARTAEAVANPNEVHRPHAGDRTRTSYSIADVVALADGAIDPLELTPLERLSGVVVQRAVEPEPRPPIGLMPTGAFGRPPANGAPRSGRREDFL